MSTPHQSTSPSADLLLPGWVRVLLLVFATASFTDVALRAVEGQVPLTDLVAYALTAAGSALIAYRVPVGVIALAAAVCAALVLSAPVGYLVMSLLVLTFALVATVRTRGWLLAYGAVVVLWTILEWILWADFPDTTFLWGQVWLQAAAVGLGLILRLLVLGRRAADQRADELRRRAERVRADERRALARDLHDVVAHELTTITLQIAATRRSQDPERLRGTLTAVDSSARSALTELRGVLDLLREDQPAGGREAQVSPASDKPLDAVLQELGRRLDDLGFQALVETDLGERPLEPMPRITAIRILQEATTNIAKHAPRGSACRLEATCRDGVLSLLVANALPKDRAARRAHREGGLGRQAMAERAHLVGGQVISGPVGDSWRVQVLIPLREQVD